MTANWMMSLPSRREVANTIAQQLDATACAKDQHNSRRQQIWLLTTLICAALGSSTAQSGMAFICRRLPGLCGSCQTRSEFCSCLGATRALVRSFLYYNGVDPNVNSAAAVKEAADRALALAPELGEAWLAQGTYRCRVCTILRRALQAYREAEKRLPNSALV